MEVVAVVVGAQLRGNVQLRAEIGANPLELRRRHRVSDVELACPIAAQLRALVGDLQIIDRVDLIGRIVPVVRGYGGRRCASRPSTPRV